MKTKEELLKTQEYWFETIQNEIYRQLNEYMKVNNISRTKLAEEMKVSKGYITQILSGDFNCSLRKLIELSLFIKKAPIIEFKSLNSIISEYSSKVVVPYNSYNHKQVDPNAPSIAEIANKSISIAYTTYSSVGNNDNKAA